jgi:hypothetical protein
MIGDMTNDRSLADGLAELLRLGVAAPEVRLPESWVTDAGLAYASLREGGIRRAEAWGEASSTDEAMREAVVKARSAIDADQRSRIDLIELVLAHRSHPRVGSEPLPNVHRGILGLEIEWAGIRHRIPPTRMIAQNRSGARTLATLAESIGLDADRLAAAPAFTFPAVQLLVNLNGRTVTEMHRGSLLVGPADVTREAVMALANGMVGWLVANLGKDGRMTYAYHPSTGRVPDSNNMIRQWMATIAMISVAEWHGDRGLRAASARNIDYNLATSYEADGELGLTRDPDGDVKLGAIALAALAITLHPGRQRWAAEEEALRRTVDHLWEPGGAFVTFYRPAGRNDNQNFYPGEALLLWASDLERGADPDLLDRFMRTFRFYRGWHRANRNPAFIPWHSMAYEKVWRRTGADDLRDFILEMNDWLLGMQDWKDVPAPDLAGRFYMPSHPEYGPPHASSDGVYLESLIAAFRVARDVGDERRVGAYRAAILRGLRHVMQLQFRGPVDAFYISRRRRVDGALRTTVYDNRIRVDNVQHNLMAVIGIMDAFTPEDWSAAPGAFGDAVPPGRHETRATP